MDMRKCDKCGIYTIKEKCPECESETKDPRPGKFSPEDKYGKYRRKEKKKENKL